MSLRSEGQPLEGAGQLLRGEPRSLPAGGHVSQRGRIPAMSLRSEGQLLRGEAALAYGW